MTSRRDVIKVGIGLAGIIAAGKAPAVVVRSMLGVGGAKYITTGGDDFPYVKNGLIAMWDGEWNAVAENGSLYHDPNATVQADISGHHNDVTMSQWATWGDKGLTCDGTHYMGYVDPAGIESVWHCEIAYNRTYSTYGYLCYLANKKIGPSDNPSAFSIAFKNNDLMLNTVKLL